MITLHCSCGETIRTGLGPASVTCKCGKVHGLPSPAPAAPAAATPAAFGHTMAPLPVPAPSAAIPPTAEPARPASDVRDNPFGPRHRVAIHDGLPAPRREPRFFAALQNPAVAGGITLGIVAVTLVAVLLLRNRAGKLHEKAASIDNGTECSFVNAGVSFTAPPGWKITKNEGMIFAFETPRGEVSVSVLQVTGETHAERAKQFQPTGDWSPSTSELAGAEALAAAWTSDAGREAGSWWLDRKNHRLWIGAEGKKGIRADAAILIKTLKLSEPAPVEKRPDEH